MENRFQEMLSGYVDGELTPDERVEFEKELAQNQELQKELETMQNLKNQTDILQYDDLPDEVWDNYWESLYRKSERGLGWVFLSIGAAILMTYGLYEYFMAIFSDETMPIYIKGAILSVSVGMSLLLVSVIRQRFFASKRDRYDAVRK